MNDVNRVYVMGNLTRDPALKNLPSGTAVADFGLAVHESFRKKDGQTSEQTSFLDVTAWEKQAETCAKYLKKGGKVLVEGKLVQEQWTAQDGTKRTRIKIRADRVHFVGGSNSKPDESAAA